MKNSTLWLIGGGFILLALAGGAVFTGGLPGSSYIQQAFAEAIARAEGFYVAGSRPQRNNNPGDLMANGQFIAYSTVSDGWAALLNQVSMMFSGGPGTIYDPSMTIGQVAQYYVDGPNATGMSPGASAWAANVANYLGVSTSTTLNNLMGA
jgi:hypothetical protein